MLFNILTKIPFQTISSGGGHLKKSTEISDDNTIDHVNGKIPFILYNCYGRCK